MDTDRRYGTFVKVGRRRLYLGQHPIERQGRPAKITTERLPRATIEVSTSALEKLQGDRHGKMHPEAWDTKERDKYNCGVTEDSHYPYHWVLATELIMSLRRAGALDQLVRPVSLIAEGQAANSFAGLRIVTNGSMPYFTKCLIYNACVQIKVFLAVNYIPIHQL